MDKEMRKALLLVIKNLQKHINKAEKEIVQANDMLYDLQKVFKEAKVEHTN